VNHAPSRFYLRWMARFKVLVTGTLVGRSLNWKATPWYCFGLSTKFRDIGPRAVNHSHGQ
jgi:hypothetical protein